VAFPPVPPGSALRCRVEAQERHIDTGEPATTKVLEPPMPKAPRRHGGRLELIDGLDRASLVIMTKGERHVFSPARNHEPETLSRSSNQATILTWLPAFQ